MVVTVLHTLLCCRPGVDSCTNGFNNRTIGFNWHRTYRCNNTGFQTVQLEVSPFAGNLLKSLLQLVVQWVEVQTRCWAIRSMWWILKCVRLIRFTVAAPCAPMLNLLENNSTAFKMEIIEWLDNKIQHAAIRFRIGLISGLVKMNFCRAMVENTLPERYGCGVMTLLD